VARLLTAGAETLNAIGDDKTMEGGITTNNTVTVDTGTVNTGSKSFKFDSGAGVTTTLSKTITPVLGTIFYARAWINLPGTGGDISSLRLTLDAANGLYADVFINSSNRSLLLRDNVGTIGSQSANLSANTWYCLELAAQNNASASTSYREARLDGVSFASSSTRNSTTVGTGTVAFGWIANPGPSKILYMDDLAINDSGGANQNSWPGLGKQVLLRPISDNALGTGWTNDNLVNTTTNLWECVNNTPPIGIADTTTSTTSDQIRNATATANSNYDANLTTYSTAGITAVDTVNLVQPWTITAAPVSTSAKQGTIGVSSNPAITNVALAAGGVSGAFWSGTAGGTYPTGWKVSPGTLTYAPSVTVGSSPVMRITQVTSSTRIAMCCFMGLYVDYTPAVVAGQVPYTNPMPQLLAQ
jgi:hypothetical protein